METALVCSAEEARLALARFSTREGICHVEGILRSLGGDDGLDARFPLTHRFANGVYAREIFLPKGSLVVGKIHKFGHLNVITKGHVLVGTENGVEDYVAPLTFISQPGAKRMVYAVEDTVWTTFHGTELTDVQQVEEEVICKTYAEFDQYMAGLGGLLEEKS